MKYEDSGVDIDRANRAKAAIAKRVRATWGPEVLSDAGAFGGLFAVPGAYKQPVLVSSMDGVGTKVQVAVMAGRFDTVGQDLVNHCVNDILVQGADPLFFLDYIASGRLDPAVTRDLIEGLSKACSENGCALIGGETAEMPGIYADGDFDLAGCIVGAVDRGDIIDGKAITRGDCVFGLSSSGLHTNGYSLVRKIFFEKLRLSVGDEVDELRASVGDELLRIHRSYLKPVRALKTSVRIKGLAHITGGGMVENLPRILPKGCGARIRKGSWPLPPIFSFIQSKGAVDEAEMYRVFNMGLGMLVVVGAEDRETVRSHRADTFHLVGEITAGDGRVEVL
jgi:phosphoribosylformylglycinamidine cyclo-ligase